jgi:hypothetical protein
MTRPKLTPHSIRKKVELQCGEISAKIWQYAQDQRMVSDVIHGEADCDWLVGQIQRLQALGSPTPQRPIELNRRERRTKGIPSRQDAISYYVAEQARGDPRVKAYRQTFLEGKLLSIEQVEPWIQRQNEQHPYRHAVIVRLPAGTTPNLDLTLTPPLKTVTHFENLERVRFIEYVRFGRSGVQRLPAPRDGPIGALYDLANSLAGTYRWQKAQASGFVLTDLTPDIEDRAVFFEDHELGVLARIHMVVDPAYTPSEIAQIYKQQRAQVLRKRGKGLSEKHTQLAILVLHQPELDRNTLRNWNLQYPRWAYARIGLFRKEALRAHKRLEAAAERRKLLYYKPATDAGIFAPDAKITQE